MRSQPTTETNTLSKEGGQRPEHKPQRTKDNPNSFQFSLDSSVIGGRHMAAVLNKIDSFISTREAV